MLLDFGHHQKLHMNRIVSSPFQQSAKLFRY